MPLTAGTGLHTLPLDEPYDLRKTLESGQTYQWRRWSGDGSLFDDRRDCGYYTVIPEPAAPTQSPEVLYVHQPDESQLRWASTLTEQQGRERLTTRLGLSPSLATVTETFPDDELLATALDAHAGLRVPCDPVFPTLISFICSPQMTVERIHQMQCRLADSYGARRRAFGQELAASPTPADIATVSEAAFRDLNIGYRASYLDRTTTLVADGDVSLAAPHHQPYATARTHLKQCIGVGNKVADCVLLFGYGVTEAVPIDTWIDTAVDTHYPALQQGSYAATSAALREYFGPYAGLAQAYVFHHLRTQS